MNTVNILLAIVEPTEDQFWRADTNGPSGTCDGDGIVNERSGRGSGRSGSGSGSNFNGNGVIDVEAEAQLPDRPRLGDSGINRNDRRS